jgi:ABC-type uncharacterized transport system permease subunit
VALIVLLPLLVEVVRADMQITHFSIITKLVEVLDTLMTDLIINIYHFRTSVQYLPFTVLRHHCFRAIVRRLGCPCIFTFMILLICLYYLVFSSCFVLIPTIFKHPLYNQV